MLLKFSFILTFLVQVDINQKLKTAPNNNYAIGVFIGQILPFVILAGLAYLFFYLAKKRRNKDL